MKLFQPLFQKITYYTLCCKKEEAIKAKIEFVLRIIPGLKMLQHVGKIHLREEEHLPVGVKILDVSNLKYAPELRN